MLSKQEALEHRLYTNWLRPWHIICHACRTPNQWICVSHSSVSGDPELPIKRVEVQFNFDTITMSYPGAAIVIDDALPVGRRIVVTDPMVTTQKRALIVAERYLAAGGVPEPYAPPPPEYQLNMDCPDWPDQLAIWEQTLEARPRFVAAF